jgi:integrase
MSGQGRQAKILSEPQIRAALAVIATSRHPLRDRVMILLSVKAGMRAKEIACLTWAMVTDAEGAIGDAIHLTNDASKGKRGGRTIPMNTNLREALIALKADRGEKAAPHRRVIYSERGDSYSAAAIAGGEPSSPKPPARSSSAGGTSATCRSSPAMPALRRSSDTSPETQRRSGGWWR